MRIKKRFGLYTLTAAVLLPLLAQSLGAQEPASAAPLLEITGHRDTVRLVRYLSPDGRNILSRAAGSAVVWDALTGEETVRLADGETVYTAAASPDGGRVYIETFAASRIVDAATGETAFRFDQDERLRLRRPVWSPSGNHIAFQERGAVHVWDVSSREVLRSFEGLSPAGYVYSIAWSPDGARLAVLQRDGALTVLRVEDGEELAAFQAHGPDPPAGGVRAPLWSADGGRLVTAANDGLVKLWDTQEWRLLHTLENDISFQFGGLNRIDHAALSADGRRIAVAQMSSLRVWDAESGQQLVRWHSVAEEDAYIPHYGGITAIAFSPDGRYLASGGLDRTAKIWDIEEETQLLHLDFLNSVETAAWSPDGSQAAFGGADGRIIVWNRAEGRETVRFEGHRNGAVIALEYAPDGTHVVTSGWDGSIRVWDAETGAQLYELPERVQPVSRLSPPRRPVEQVSYSPRGGRFLTVSDVLSYNSVELWDHADRGGPAITLDSQVQSAAWSPDGRRVAAAHTSYVAVWDTDNLQSPPLEFRPGNGAGDTEYRQAAWSRDGSRLLIASSSGATVLDWASNDPLRALTLERGASYVQESRDGSLLLTIDGRFSGPAVQVWDMATGVELAAMETSGSRIGARFSPDGKRVVAYGGRAPELRVWDAATGEQLLALRGRRAPFIQAEFSPDGRRLAGASRDRTTWMWDAATGDSLAVFPSGGGGLVFSPDGTRVAGFGATGAAVWSTGPHFTSESIVHAASFAPGAVAPGQIVSIFGAGLGPATAVRGAVDPETGLLPTALAGASVLLDGEPIPLLHVQESQINAQIPYEAAGRANVRLAVSYGGVTGPGAALAVSPAQPALFLIPGGKSALMLNENGRLNSPLRPARPGESVTLFGSGQGETSPPAQTGRAASAMDEQRIEDVSVSVGGRAAEVVSAGLAPGFAGVFQIRARIPETVATGAETPVSIVIRGVSGPEGAVMAVAAR